MAMGGGGGTSWTRVNCTKLTAQLILLPCEQVADEKQQLAALQAERARLQEEIQQLDQSKQKLEKNQKKFIKYYGHQSTQTVDRWFFPFICLIKFWSEFRDTFKQIKCDKL